MAIAPGPSQTLFRVMVLPASGANVTVPEPGEVVRLTAGILADVHVQFVPGPPTWTELRPVWPEVFGSINTVPKVPPETVMTLTDPPPAALPEVIPPSPT